MSRRRRTAALAAILLIAAAAIAIVLAQPGSRTASAAGSGVPAGFTTATVERRTLTERSTVDGTLGYAGAAEIYDRLAGTFTWLPAVGAVIHRGGTLFKVNNLPVALMYGDVPAYRALEEGVSDGPDVRELNANLVLLGFDPSGAIDVDEHFSGATAAAVRHWQHAEGLSETGQVELGRVVFAPGARRVTTVHVSIGQDPPGSGADRSGSSSPSKSEAEGGSGSRSPSSGEGSDNKGSGTSGSGKEGSDKKGSGPSGSGKEGSDKKGSGTSGSGKEGSGKEGSGKEGSGSGGSPSGGGAAPELVLSTTADDQIVTLQLKATQQELAHVGERVPVALPDGRTVHGRVSEVGSVASESSGEGENGGSAGGGSGGSGGGGENATISVKVTLDRPVARLDKAPVSVELVKSVRRNVLAVPATALVATAGNGFAVQALEGIRRVEVPVTPGMFANGYVEVEGAALREGMMVLEPR